MSVLALSWLGWSVPLQAVVNGMVIGLGYAVIAAGLVLIYRSSGIVNFAQAAMGAFGISVFALMFINYDLPYPLAAFIGIASSAILGAATELLVVRRLFESSRVVLLIATVGIAQLIIFLYTTALPDPEFGSLPIAFDAKWAEIQIGDSLRLGARETSVVLLVVPVLGALGYFLTRTRTGLWIRAVADHSANSRLSGVSPKKVSTLVWSLGAGFAAYTQIVLAPITTRTAQELAAISITGLLLRGLVIGLAARMRSIPIVVAAGMALGVAETLVSLNLNRSVGIFDLFLLLAVLVLVVLRGRGQSNETPFTIGSRRSTVPDHLQQIWWVKRLPQFGLLFLLLVAIVIPMLIDKPSEIFVWSKLLLYAAVAISFTLLTGWAGQLSLGQFAFVGVGALSTLAVTQGWHVAIGIPFVGELFSFELRLQWIMGLLVGTLVGVVFSLLIGLPSLRVRGLFLAVSTLAFAAMAAGWMFGQTGWNGGNPRLDSYAGDRPTIGPIDFRPPKTYYFMCLAFLVLVVAVVARVRRTGAGRAMIAVRDNEAMTSASTVSPVRAKLWAFGMSGGIAAMAGGLYAFLVPGMLPAGAESDFSPAKSLQLVAIAIIGGLGSIGGAILGALWVVGLPALFGFNDAVQLLTANIGLLILLLYFPGGLIQIVESARDFLVSKAAKGEAPAATTTASRDAALPARRRERREVAAGAPVLALEQVTVTFGGLRAVDSVTMEVRPNEIVGLIGTNGAGKSTLMNAISGFVPSTGKIELLGVDITGSPAHERHRVGLGRGFQDAGLFAGLTVRETLMVALEGRERSQLLPSAFALPWSSRAERRKRSEAEDIIDFLGLGRWAGTGINDLSTGLRRVVELGCLIATDARVLLLDEPTGGMAQKETEAFAPLIRQVQRELDASLVVIEHDMPLIMSISDRVYCLEAGAVISEGSPSHVRNDPRVIASYLGTDDRAIIRSNQELVVE